VRRSAPIRSCVGCGDRDAQAGLLRVVLIDGRLTPDPLRRAAGRGAYLHRRASCADAFVARRGAVRSLRATPPRVDRERLVAALAASGEITRSGGEIAR
jgi:predicted RNA-binding protein YlxR (DUF448 family)